MNVRRLAVVASILLCTSVFADEPQLRKDVAFLAAPATDGRGISTNGIHKAAEYIEGRLKSIGLQPAFGTSYRQLFPIKTGVALGNGNKLEGVADGDWTPLGFSSPGAFAGPIAFVGYGIDATPIGYNDFDGIDLKGKVAVMLRYEPQEKDDASKFDGRKPSRWSAMRYKVLQARERGAVAVIFTTGPLQDEGKDKVPPLVNDGPESPAGIPVLQVKTSVAEKWVGDLTAWQKSVDADLKPRSKVLETRISGVADVKPQFVDAENIAGILPGRGALANEVVVLGAHYDHLGYGGQGSMKPNEHAIHPGADDNASGDAAIMAIAERLKTQLADVNNRRTIVVALFSGEEVGLAGSSWFVGHSPLIPRVVAMINLDMVGQMRDNRLIVFGSDSAPQWKEVVDAATSFSKINVTSSGDGYGPSDQTSFYAKQIPVLHFFTGAHDRYHTPEDVAESLNYAGIEHVVDFGTSVMMHLASGRVTPQYARAASAPAMEGDSRGYGAYLGTVPDYSAMSETTGGVLLADVRPGSPADKAGIRGKDRIVSIGGTRIENLYDMSYALQDHKPGDTVDIIVIRNGEKKSLRATLTTRGGAAAPAPKVSSLVIKAGKPYEKTFDGEKHLKDIRQLTFGGENAEAYFSPDGTKIIYQATVPGAGCDQEYTMDLVTGETKLVSSGKGRTTCGYFKYPQGDRIVYATTEGGAPECPAKPDMSHGYVWPVYPSFDIVEANVDGSNAKKITATAGYDAEMTWCHQGGKMIFTSMRDGDLDLYEMDAASGKVKRLTNTPGYDGGAFYNGDCTQIVWRANHPAGPALDEDRALLAKDLVKPLHMELFLMNADGTNQRQITSNGAANFCPYFMNDGKRIIFASNVNAKGFDFDLWTVGKDGQGLERITTAPGFDGFCVFSPDGQYLIWASSRAQPEGHEMNLFIAKWVE
ncbi:MAG: M28 family peptidase [Acidobacteria bacterium]|nr:M28 family peptidase [Acidobacteriota bacterium]MBV9069950.1 M28 family peptidase [Acidobacteriota bacterium]MBV9185622.1 M28 family peptidase [Acidobacteriota bacterium]